MRQKTWFEKTLDAVRDSLEYRLEGIILSLTEQICQRMKDKRVTRTQLAEKLQVSPAAVTKILNGNSNFTLKTLLTIGDALNLDLAVNFRPKESLIETQQLSETCMAWTANIKNVAITTATSLTATSSVLLNTSITADLGFNPFGIPEQQKEMARA